MGVEKKTRPNYGRFNQGSRRYSALPLTSQVTPQQEEEPLRGRSPLAQPDCFDLTSSSSSEEEEKVPSAGAAEGTPPPKKKSTSTAGECLFTLFQCIFILLLIQFTLIE
jgi:hypothetical protein